MNKTLAFLLVLSTLLLTGVSMATDTEPAPTSPGFLPMDLERLDGLIRRIDGKVQRQGPQWEFGIGERRLLIIADAKANRMRVMTPIVKVDQLSLPILHRALQADFDAALDARYAIANGMMWSIFLHPLSSLHQEDLISGITQVVIAAQTFGTTYSSGSLVFGGGDSDTEHEKLFKELKNLTTSKDAI